MSKPVIVGMNNPHSADPRYALFPSPVHSAGGRLFNMIRTTHEQEASDEGPYLRQHYLDTFERRNVLGTRTWNRTDGRREGAVLVREHLGGRRVVVLGRQVELALGLPPQPWFGCGEYEHPLLSGSASSSITYWTIPHPSGMCRVYNDRECQLRAGRLLLALASGARDRDLGDARGE